MFPFYTPLKTPENLVFRGYKMGTLAGNGLRSLSLFLIYEFSISIVFIKTLLSYSNETTEQNSNNSGGLC